MEVPMSRRRRENLREFTEEEQHTLTQFARSQRVPAVQSRRAGILLEVASGKSLLEASRSQGFKDGDTASSLVHRFNLEGLGARANAPSQGVGERPSKDKR